MALSGDETKVADELSRLLKIGLEFRPDDSINPIEFNQFQTLGENILELGFGVNSVFYKRFSSSYDMVLMPYELNDPRLVSKKRLPVQIGALQAALDALNRGLTKDLFYEREMIVFSVLLDQAYNFLENESTYLAAGVYGRIVLETAVREFAKLKLQENYNPQMKFNQLIFKLRNEGFILQTFEERLKSYYTIGSDAAHNSPDFKKYSKKDLKDFLTSVKDNVLTLK